MTEAIHCIGCGAIIQTENPHELGYTPKTAFEKEWKQGSLLPTLFSLKTL